MIENEACPMCGHKEATLLGKLGILTMVRCRACHWDYGMDVDTNYEEEDDDENEIYE